MCEIGMPLMWGSAESDGAESVSKAELEQESQDGEKEVSGSARRSEGLNCAKIPAAGRENAGS